MRILIIEDYPTIARSLERQLRGILGPRIETVDIAGDLAAARAALQAAPADLIFLDLNLGGRDGFDVLKWATAASAHTVVVSANAHRAVEAFEHGVLDFVPKPVAPGRLRQALERFDGARQGDTRIRWLSIRGSRGHDLVPLDRIRRIQAAGKYSEVHLLDGPARLHDKSLDRLEVLLPSAFTRVHRSHIVNLDHARRLVVQGGGRYDLLLDDESSVPVGRTRYPALRDRLG